MDDLETLLRHGWLDDPADTVRVEAVHADACASGRGSACDCRPRFLLSGAVRRPARSSPSLDPWPHPLASGE